LELEAVIHLMMTSWNADIPPKRGRETTGRISELSRGRSCGVIRSSDGRNVFFHGRDLEGAKYNDVEVGGAVSFELIDDNVSGPRAHRVRLTRRQKRSSAQPSAT
jgi:cold shock CspA family protein